MQTQRIAIDPFDGEAFVYQTNVKRPLEIDCDIFVYFNENENGWFFTKSILSKKFKIVDGYPSYHFREDNIQVDIVSLECEIICEKVYSDDLLVKSHSISYAIDSYGNKFRILFKSANYKTVDLRNITNLPFSESFVGFPTDNLNYIYRVETSDCGTYHKSLSGVYYDCDYVYSKESGHTSIFRPLCEGLNIKRWRGRMSEIVRVEECNSYEEAVKEYNEIKHEYFPHSCFLYTKTGVFV